MSECEPAECKSGEYKRPDVLERLQNAAKRCAERIEEQLERQRKINMLIADLQTNVDSACIAAESELALQSEFKLPRPQWNAFLAALDEPATVNPALRRLLAEPSVIELANRK